jgi:hemerythrin-like domain-containing protein
MDIIQALKKDHEEIKKMFKEMDGTQDGKKQMQIFSELSEELSSHIKLEEKYFYKMSMEMEELRMDILKGYEEHTLVKKLLREIPRAGDTSVSMAKAMVVQELVLEHVKEEERQIFPKAKKMMDKEILKQAGEKYEMEHEKMEKMAA